MKYNSKKLLLKNQNTNPVLDQDLTNDQTTDLNV